MKVYTALEQLPDLSGCVLTIGSFDGVHIGHREIIRRLQSLTAQGGGETVLLSFHPHPRKVVAGQTPPRLLSTFEEKIARLRQTGLQHLVIIPFTPSFSTLSPEAYLRDFLQARFHPRCIAIGYDHRYGQGRQGDLALMQRLSPELGFEVEEISAQTIEDIAVSSTKIRQALEKGEVKKAATWLGYAYTLSGQVVAGQQLGRQLGFPTANLHIGDADKLIPGYGVYACYAWTGGQRYKAMLYIGRRPTLDAEQSASIEAHLFDFQGDLYGQTLSLELMDFLREETKFENLQALQLALQQDAQHALACL